MQSQLNGLVNFIKTIFRTGTYRLIEMPTEFISDPGFGGPNIPDFSAGQLNTTIDTPLAGSILNGKFGVGSGPIRFPEVYKVTLVKNAKIIILFVSNTQINIKTI